MIPVYNESDIIESVVRHLISQGVDLVILDNGSTDGTYEICSRFLGHGVISIEKLITEHFNFDLLEQQLYQQVLNRDADWALLSGADEFLESPYPHVTLEKAIESDDQKGYNLIQFNNFEFWPTEQDYASHESDARKRIRYYTWNDDMQFRCWKIIPNIRVTGTTGHYPQFPEGHKVRIPHTKYILRHYRIRSYEQGVRKIFIDRLPRYPEEDRKKGLHVQYDKFERDPKFFIINSKNLTLYQENTKWNLKKTFDWTWGLQAKHWAHPPSSQRLIRLASKLPPICTQIWKSILLRNKPLPLSVIQEEKSRKSEEVF